MTSIDECGADVADTGVSPMVLPENPFGQPSILAPFMLS